MINKISNGFNPSFGRVLPVTVEVDGKTSYDRKEIESAIRNFQAVLLMSGNAKPSSKMKPEIKARNEALRDEFRKGTQEQIGSDVGNITDNKGKHFLLTQKDARVVKSAADRIIQVNRQNKWGEFREEKDYIKAINISKDSYGKVIKQLIENARDKDEPNLLIKGHKEKSGAVKPVGIEFWA